MDSDWVTKLSEEERQQVLESQFRTYEHHRNQILKLLRLIVGIIAAGAAVGSVIIGVGIPVVELPSIYERVSTAFANYPFSQLFIDVTEGVILLSQMAFALGIGSSLVAMYQGLTTDTLEPNSDTDEGHLEDWIVANSDTLQLVKLYSDEVVVGLSVSVSALAVVGLYMFGSLFVPLILYTLNVFFLGLFITWVIMATITRIFGSYSDNGELRSRIWYWGLRISVAVSFLVAIAI